MDFKEKIKKLRDGLSLSQETLARMLGVTYATINRLENGKTLPSYKTLKNFEKFCELNRDKLKDVYKELIS